MNFKQAFKNNQSKNIVINLYESIIKKWPVPYYSFYLDTKYGKTFIIKSGDNTNPPLILLHGTSSNSAMWMDDIKEYIKNYCVYAIDIPGEPGKSAEKQYSLKDKIYFKWLNEVVKKLEIKNISIVGISLGGWLATGYTINYPTDIKKLVLLCPSGIGSQKISFIFKSIPLMLLGEYGHNKIVEMVNGNQKMTKEAVNYSKIIAKNFNLRKEPVPIYSDTELKNIKIPLLVIVGEKDVLLKSKETIEKIKTLIPTTETILLKNHGHVLIGFKNEISKFLTK